MEKDSSRGECCHGDTTDVESRPIFVPPPPPSLLALRPRHPLPLTWKRKWMAWKRDIQILLLFLYNADDDEHVTSSVVPRLSRHVNCFDSVRFNHQPILPHDRRSTNKYVTYLYISINHSIPYHLNLDPNSLFQSSSLF